ncbi:hypothetical protein AB0J01_41375 [Streptomyces sp. NPDC050204]|uniref:hypothetical protein n=1 Tax=Streptomyces sp. NPDC050204 TaxID=3155514 RepID=UPI003445212C
MFAKLRRKRRPTAIPAHRPAPPVSVVPELELADSRTVVRAERLRHALQKAGADLDALAPEPAWFAAARAGQLVTVGADERAELIAHLGSATTASVTSDEACDQTLARIEAFTVLREMRAEGMTVRTCGGVLSADALRAIRDTAREVERNHTDWPADCPE